MIRRGLALLWAGLLLAGLLILPSQTASAHAVLIQADPPPNSRLDVSPAQITLVFNERLEKELYYIRVYDAEGKSIAVSSTEMSLDQTSISAKLPTLGSGVYTVSYHLISADGHPVERAYILTVGDPSADSFAAALDDPPHLHGGWVLWVDRLLYYLSMLLLTGWVFWGAVVSLPSEETRKEYRFWLKYLKLFYIFILIGMGFMQVSGFLDGFGIREIDAGFVGTTFGQTWLFSVVLALAGYFVLGRRKWFDFLWISLIWLAEAVNGHAYTFGSKFYSIPLDAVHLAAAGVWTGGLLLVLIFWKKDRDWTKRFIRLFSKIAFFSLIGLAVTGLLLTLAFVPELTMLLDTKWGILLLIKTFLVLLVVPVAAILRSKLAKGEDDSFRAWFKRDFSLMLLIVLVVGGLTYSNPLPANEPLAWQAGQNGITAHAAIQPNNPGVENSFAIQLEMPNSTAAAPKTEMRLYYKGKQEIAPIQVPLKDSGSSTEGGKKAYFFSGSGPYLSIPGKWMLEIRVLDEHDNETVFTKNITLFQVGK